MTETKTPVHYGDEQMSYTAYGYGPDGQIADEGQNWWNGSSLEDMLADAAQIVNRPTWRGQHLDRIEITGQLYMFTGDAWSPTGRNRKSATVRRTTVTA